ncbi:hypothetical protein ACWFQ8_30325 [Streptomyces sp. NPDC055254]
MRPPAATQAVPGGGHRDGHTHRRPCPPGRVRRHRLRLPALHHHAPDFGVGHHAALTLLDSSPTPAATWLHTGPTDPPLLAARDRAALLAALRQRAAGPVEHLAHALTADPHVLGDPAAALTRVAAGPGGLGTVSWLLLQVLAWRLDPKQGVILFRPFNPTRIAPGPPPHPSGPGDHRCCAHRRPAAGDVGRA